MIFSVILERALPLTADIIARIESGELKIHGGTIRDVAGKIVKHLIFPQEGQPGQKSPLEQLEKQLGQNHAEVMEQLASQTASLSAINIMSAQQTTETLGQQLEEISEKIDALDHKAEQLLDEARFSKLIKISEIKSSALAAIEEALYANQKQSDHQFIRLHITPLRRALNDLDTLLRSMLDGLDNKAFIENVHFVMLVADLKNKATFVLCQTHIRLEEDDIAQGYFARNADSNALLRHRLQELKKTGALSPHVISREALDMLKSDVVNFRQLETQSEMLSSQNTLALALKVPQCQLLNNPFDAIRMLDPVPVGQKVG